MNNGKKDWDVTDNRAIDKFPVCKDCKYRDKSFDMGYIKCQCEKFVYPDIKPQKLFRGSGECEHKEQE